MIILWFFVFALILSETVRIIETINRSNRKERKQKELEEKPQFRSLKSLLAIQTYLKQRKEHSIALQMAIETAEKDFEHPAVEYILRNYEITFSRFEELLKTIEDNEDWDNDEIHRQVRKFLEKFSDEIKAYENQRNIFKRRLDEASLASYKKIVDEEEEFHKGKNYFDTELKNLIWLYEIENSNKKEKKAV